MRKHTGGLGTVRSSVWKLCFVLCEKRAEISKGNHVYPMGMKAPIKALGGGGEGNRKIVRMKNHIVLILRTHVGTLITIYGDTDIFQQTRVAI